MIDWLLNATFTIGGSELLWREVIGNGFGLASALGGMRRKVWAWPVGIVGNVLLFTVFLGSWFGSEGRPDMLGQAGRQVMFVAVSVYGWMRWRETRKQALEVRADGKVPSSDAEGVHPQWATWPQRAFLVGALVVGTLALTPLFKALGSYEPVWADAWIFMGSLLATYGMARGWSSSGSSGSPWTSSASPCCGRPSTTPRRSCTCSTARSPSSGSSCGGGSTAANGSPRPDTATGAAPSGWEGTAPARCGPPGLVDPAVRTVCGVDPRRQSVVERWPLRRTRRTR